MKLCAIILSLGSLIGGVETVIDTHLKENSKPEVAFSRSASPAIPSLVPADPQRAVEEALADARNREISIADLFQPREEQ